jgi:predicted TIM-barrel fold metal-dependent hydrolase
MNARKKRKIIDAHVHLYDHGQNRHEFLETQYEVFDNRVCFRHALAGLRS